MSMTPTPHQPDCNIDIEALRRRIKDAESFLEGTVRLANHELTALLDHLERAEARALPVWAHYDETAGTITLFGIKYASELFQDFGSTMPLGELFSIASRNDGALTVMRAAAGAVREGFALVPLRLTPDMSSAFYCAVGGPQGAWTDMIAAAPPAQGLPAAPENVLDAKRHRYTRATTTAIRDPETGERIEITPEMYDAAIDRAMATDPDAKLGIKAKDISAAAPSEPVATVINRLPTEYTEAGAMSRSIDCPLPVGTKLFGTVEQSKDQS